MQISEVKRVMSGLEPDQSKRLKQYCSQLATDKDPRHWDGHMAEFLKRNTINPGKFIPLINTFKRMGFNQSKYEYAKIQEALAEFQKPEVSDYSTYSEYFSYAREVMTKWAHGLRLRQRRYDSEKDIAAVIPKKSTHAGFSYFLTGKKHKGEYLGDLLPIFNLFVDEARKHKSMNRPIVIGSRTQASLLFDDDGSLKRNEFKQKTRLVSMIDILQILVECLWSERVQYAMSMVDWYAGGKDDSAVNSILQEWRRHYNYYISIDYSHYDQSIPSWLIHESFNVIREAFVDMTPEDEELFKIMKDDFIHKCFIDGEGNLVEAHKGVPSGSMFTQIIDSIANRLMILSYMKAKGFYDEEYRMMIMGDDNIIFSTHKLDLHDLAAFLSRNYGVECHPDKCTQGSCEEDPEFLSRTWTPEGVYRDPIILLSKLVAPERFRDYNTSEFTELDYYGKVHREIVMLVHAYKLSFPLGMKEIISVDGYDQLKFKGDAVARSKLTTGLVKYMAEIKNYLEFKPAI